MIRHKKRSHILSFAALILIVVLAFVCGMGKRANAQMQEDDKMTFESANQNYREGKYSDAIRLYQGLAEKYPGQGVFFYNLGNSYFRNGALGKAILSYERARLHEPRDKDIYYNLKYLNGLLEYRVDDKRNWYIRTGEIVLQRFTVKEMGVLLLMTYFTFMAGNSFVVFFLPGEPWKWKRKAALTLFLVFAVLFGLKQVEENVLKDAIVTTQEAEIRYGPSAQDQVAFRLGEGLKVQVIDSREKWSRILLANRESGWVRQSDIAIV
ncbi:MAG: SH3 domain-containing protein [Candidatus Omnitrophota bacterium]|nr:SH3 domain-containing protein [Candidatus Omnitrophota bacterium]